MKNYLDKKINFFTLMKLTLPTVVMMIFFSLYTIIDGVFVSNFVGANALSSLNIVIPIVLFFSGVSVMFATGGSAIVAKYMGEKNIKEARETFSLLIVTLLIIGTVIAIVSFIFINDIIRILGGTDLLFKDCYAYLAIMLLFSPFVMLKMYFDYFLVTAGVPMLALVSSIIGGILNIIFDYIFIAELGMGISGAAIATGIGYVVPAIIGIFYFYKKKNILHFVKPKLDFSLIKDSCINGLSEMVTQLAAAVATFLFNIVMIKFLGEDGVASITIVLYAELLLNSAYIGFTSGVAPRISYSYGSKDQEQLKKIVRYSYITIGIFAVLSFVISNLISENLIAAFSPKGSSIFNITLEGFTIFSVGFLISGFNIFTSGMFTAYSNGKISAMLSFLRTLVLFIVGIIVLPYIFGVTGVWLVIPFAEAITSIFGLICVLKYRTEYMYGSSSSTNERPLKRITSSIEE
ncbi:MATE family efflux transporter [Clostridium sp. LIBA-8841]|uniref:MATE family efflux transporter n=1 Tax=Clostridium sp. LIBA-8841 TaxID=2987530 RepID=UPI002AC57BE8|nr:MATE family efflux transporter [Clostridium sp. LIBA-8841]MDZ5253783.1 MATE family efflux transporter [Clostridium sp. LIBA-8841]